MSSVKYSLVSQEGGSSTLTFVIDGEMFVVDNSHPGFVEIRTRVLAGDPSAKELVNPEKALSTKFETLSERVAVKDGNIYFDGDVVNNTLTEQVLRFLDEGVDDWAPLVEFWENLAANPNEHSREQLYRWLDTHKFAITPDGYIVGYKGVNTNLTSIHAGPAIVDGEQKNGNIPNQPGSVIEMPRSEVQFDPSVACHTGLHVGTYDYARSFGSVVLEVHVNPRDVVSVPTDCNDAKMRTCRYTVVKTVDQAYSSSLVEDEEGNEDDYDECCDDSCGMYGCCCDC